MRLLRDQPVPGVTLAHVGTFVASGLWLRNESETTPLTPAGWEHALS
jgi:hypothetical protein